jgi:hypothetical protein
MIERSPKGPNKELQKLMDDILAGKVKMHPVELTDAQQKKMDRLEKFTRPTLNKDASAVLLPGDKKYLSLIGEENVGNGDQPVISKIFPDAKNVVQFIDAGSLGVNDESVATISELQDALDNDPNKPAWRTSQNTQEK